MDQQPLIVLTTDFSEEAARAYAKTVELAERMGGRILLLNVVENLSIPAHGAPLAPPQDDPDLPRHLKAAQKRLGEEQAKLGSDVPVETATAVASGEIADAIVKFAADRGAEMIALSTHGRTGLRRMILGSVAEGVVRQARCPVLSFPGR